MLTVVCKLFLLTRADLAFFGEKDYQQLALVKRMVRDLEHRRSRCAACRPSGSPTAWPVQPQPLPVGRRARRPRSCSPGRLRAGAAETSAERALSAADKILSAGTGVRVDYLALTDPLLGPAPADGPARLLVAARVGATRLIDNVPLVLKGA